MPAALAVQQVRRAERCRGCNVGGSIAAGIGLFFMKDDLCRAAGEFAAEVGSADEAGA